jgi:AraC-like DNA-binding protein
MIRVHHEVVDTGGFVTAEERRDDLASFAEQIAPVIPTPENRTIRLPHDVVDTDVDVTATEKQRHDSADFNSTLPVESETKAAPFEEQIASVIRSLDDRVIRAPQDVVDTDVESETKAAPFEEQIASVIRSLEIPIVRAPIDLSTGASETSETLSEQDRAEIDRYLTPVIQQRQETAKVSRSVLRVKRAIELYRSGVPTIAQAASRIGISERQLRRAFKAVGESPPWTHGGRRAGAGRKSSGHPNGGFPTA